MNLPLPIHRYLFYDFSCHSVTSVGVSFPAPSQKYNLPSNSGLEHSEDTLLALINRTTGRSLEAKG